MREFTSSVYRLPIAAAALLVAFAGCAKKTNDAAVPPTSSNPGPDPTVAATGFCAGAWRWQNPLPQGNDLNAVWGSATNDVWVVGDGGTILHWDGRAWSPRASGTTRDLTGVWASGPNDAWAVGNAGTVLRWDGGAWTGWSLPAGSRIGLSSVWGSAANDVWAAGWTYDSVSDTTIGSALLHWDGEAWSTVASGVANALTGIWGSDASHVWAVGAGGAILAKQR